MRDEQVVSQVVQQVGDLAKALTFHYDEGAQQRGFGVSGIPGGGNCILNRPGIQM